MTMNSIMISDAEFTSGRQLGLPLQLGYLGILQAAMAALTTWPSSPFPAAHGAFVVGPSETETPESASSPRQIFRLLGLETVGYGNTLDYLTQEIALGQFNVPAELLGAAGDALRRIDNTQGENIQEWAWRLAQDVADATD
jgi:hypothetical protein